MGLYVSWYIDAGGFIKAGWYIEACESIKAGWYIEAGESIKAGWYIEAGKSIKAGGYINAGEFIKAGWSSGISAGLSITCKGTLTFGLKCFAGVYTWGEITEEEKTITCGKLEGGTIEYGILVETGLDNDKKKELLKKADELIKKAEELKKEAEKF